MSKVIIFSRVFPKGNKREGQPTFFVEKIWKYVWDAEKSSMNPLRYYQPNYDDLFHPMGEGQTNIHQYFPKLHTIRAGKRWKVGDVFSPRVWTDKPYKSKQMEFAPELEVKQVYDIEIINQKVIINGVSFGEYARGFYDDNVTTLANNDGLSIVDFENWFGNKFFQGQIICWSDAVSYGFR